MAGAAKHPAWCSPWRDTAPGAARLGHAARSGRICSARSGPGCWPPQPRSGRAPIVAAKTQARQPARSESGRYWRQRLWCEHRLAGKTHCGGAKRPRSCLLRLGLRAALASESGRQPAPGFFCRVGGKCGGCHRAIRPSHAARGWQSPGLGAGRGVGQYGQERPCHQAFASASRASRSLAGGCE